jgi:hypothetical protein
MEDPEAPEPNHSAKPKPDDHPNETPLDSAGEVEVEHHSTPPPGPADQKIHLRRPLPLVPTSGKDKK